MKFYGANQVIKFMKKLLQSVAFKGKYFDVYGHVTQGWSLSIFNIGLLFFSGCCPVERICKYLGLLKALKRMFFLTFLICADHGDLACKGRGVE